MKDYLNQYYPGLYFIEQYLQLNSNIPIKIKSLSITNGNQEDQTNKFHTLFKNAATIMESPMTLQPQFNAGIKQLVGQVLDQIRNELDAMHENDKIYRQQLILNVDILNTIKAISQLQNNIMFQSGTIVSKKAFRAIALADVLDQNRLLIKLQGSISQLLDLKIHTTFDLHHFINNSFQKEKQNQQQSFKYENTYLNFSNFLQQSSVALQTFISGLDQLENNVLVESQSDQMNALGVSHSETLYEKYTQMKKQMFEIEQFFVSNQERHFQNLTYHVYENHHRILSGAQTHLTSIEHRCQRINTSCGCVVYLLFLRDSFINPYQNVVTGRQRSLENNNTTYMVLPLNSTKTLKEIEAAKTDIRQIVQGIKSTKNNYKIAQIIFDHGLFCSIFTKKYINIDRLQHSLKKQADHVLLLIECLNNLARVEAKWNISFEEASKFLKCARNAVKKDKKQEAATYDVCRNLYIKGNQHISDVNNYIESVVEIQEVKSMESQTQTQSYQQIINGLLSQMENLVEEIEGVQESLMLSIQQKSSDKTLAASNVWLELCQQTDLMVAQMTQFLFSNIENNGKEFNVYDLGEGNYNTYLQTFLAKSNANAKQLQQQKSKLSFQLAQDEQDWKNPLSTMSSVLLNRIQTSQENLSRIISQYEGIQLLFENSKYFTADTIHNVVQYFLESFSRVAEQQQQQQQQYMTMKQLEANLEGHCKCMQQFIVEKQRQDPTHSNALLQSLLEERIQFESGMCSIFHSLLSLHKSMLQLRFQHEQYSEKQQQSQYSQQMQLQDTRRFHPSQTLLEQMTALSEVFDQLADVERAILQLQIQRKEQGLPSQGRAQAVLQQATLQMRSILQSLVQLDEGRVRQLCKNLLSLELDQDKMAELMRNMLGLVESLETQQDVDLQMLKIDEKETNIIVLQENDRILYIRRFCELGNEFCSLAKEGEAQRQFVVQYYMHLDREDQEQQHFQTFKDYLLLNQDYVALIQGAMQLLLKYNAQNKSNEKADLVLLSEIAVVSSEAKDVQLRLRKFVHLIFNSAF